jgi:putative ABC transport system permease protein
MTHPFVFSALRHLRKYKGYTLVNIVGLAMGIACCLVILLFVREEWRFDRFHADADRIYRVYQDLRGSTLGEGNLTYTAAIMGPLLKEDFREIEQVVRLSQASVYVGYQGGGQPLVFKEEDFYYVDSTFFDLFSFPFLYGDPATALRQPRSVVLTASTARKYFGSEDPLGKELVLDQQLGLQVTGVLQDLPSASTLQFDLIAPMGAFLQSMGMADFPPTWWWPPVDTYVRLAPGADVAALNATGLPAFVAKYREPEIAATIIPQVTPLTRLRLYGLNDDGTRTYVYIFSAIGALILLIACINFVNLSTARAARRTLEIGVRKAIGADRRQLVGQFLGESLAVTGVALFLGLVFAELMLPVVNELAGGTLALRYSDPWFWLSLLILLLVTGLLAGGYPAFFMARFSPIEALRKGARTLAGGRGLRQVLVVFQFSISIVLLVATLVVYYQLDYVRSQALGFQDARQVALPLEGDREVLQRLEAFQAALRQQAPVGHVAASSWLPGIAGGTKMPASYEGMAPDVSLTPWVLYVDAHFFETVPMDALVGRVFTPSYTGDAAGAFIVNETLARQAASGIVGRPFRISYGENGQTVYEKTGPVVGVVRDFHHHDLRTAIEPVVITLAERPEQLQYILVDLRPGDLRTARAAIESVWNGMFSHRPVELRFLDEELDRVYRQDLHFGFLVTLFALLSIAIACMGLLGLAAYTAEQRTKEIGIRKVMGASAVQILVLLSRDVVRLVLVAVVVALPVAWIVMGRWLAQFVYHIEVPPLALVVAVTAVLAIALATVGFQSLKVARLDPARSMRYE